MIHEIWEHNTLDCHTGYHIITPLVKSIVCTFSSSLEGLFNRHMFLVYHTVVNLKLTISYKRNRFILI